MKNVENIQVYLTKLQYHDWYYHFSDDLVTWRKGHENHDSLVETAVFGGVEYMKLFNTFHEKHFKDCVKDYKHPFVV